jgi:putative tryptophan/tyrosine transport system substrate-binding protein
MTARKALPVFLALCFLVPSCRAPKTRLYTIGYLQLLESPTNADVRRGFMKALEDKGFKDGLNIRVKIGNAMNDISQVQRLAQEFVMEPVDVLVAVSTPSLQTALISTQTIPIVFTSVANPYLTRAGISPAEHLPNVTGVASTGPIRQALVFMKEVLPNVKRIGTLWTPSERNSEYYLELARAAAWDLDLEIIAVPVANSSEVLLAAQVLVNKKIDAIYQISDNTINASFEALGKVAEENRVPLFGGFLLATRSGACAALGLDFFDMGFKTGEVVIRIKNGEKPVTIPFQSMTSVKLSLNLPAAERQGVAFPAGIQDRAGEIIRAGQNRD